LSFLLNKKKPKTLAEAHKMAMQIERSLFMTKTDAVDTLSSIKLVSHETFVEDAQERRKQVFSQQNENVIKEQEPEQELEQDNEVSTCAPPADEVIQEPVSPVQRNEDEVSNFPLQNSNDTVLLDSKEEEEMEASDEVKWKQSMRMKKQHMLKTPSPRSTCTRRNSKLPSSHKF
jgi:hypothetical protein